MILVVLHVCNTPGYPTTPSPTDYALLFSVTEKGAERFIQRAVTEIMGYAQQMEIPDIHVTLNLGVTDVEIGLLGLKISRLDISGISAVLRAGENISVNVERIDVQMDFLWHIEQTSYPFFDDNGTGVLRLGNASVATGLNSEIDVDCNGHVLISVDYIELRFKKLEIELLGGNSWLYQAFIDLILDSLKSEISDIISELIIQATEQYFTEYMESSAYYLPVVTQHAVIKDDRFVDKFVIGDHLLTMVFSGYFYKFDTLTDQYITSGMLNAVDFGRFNAELVFAVHASGFDNLYYIFHKYYNAYSDARFNASEPPKLIVENIANRVIYKFEFESTTYITNLICKLLVNTKEVVDPSNNMTITVALLSENCTCATIENIGGSSARQYSDQEVCDMAADFFTEANQNTPYQINNTPFMDILTFSVINDAEQRVIRLIGNVPSSS